MDEEEDWLIAEKLMNKFIFKKPSEILDLKFKLFASDVNEVMTDAGMYYSETGEELKKFNTYDGMAFQLLREQGIKKAIFASEITKIVRQRAKKPGVNYLFQGKLGSAKLGAILEICDKEGLSVDEVAYIGDDINCLDLLRTVGFPACPRDAIDKIKKVPNIKILTKKGGEGAVREFVSYLMNSR